MTAYVALLRAVNVGGTGKLPMSELKAMCEGCGFEQVKTYIASGNVVFASDLAETKVKAKLEKSLAAHAGKPVGAMVRTAAEMAEVVKKNPFKKEPPARVAAFFLDESPPANVADTAAGLASEVIKAGKREIYVCFPDGMGQSKLRMPAAKTGTARNMNTVAKLAEMAAALDA